MERMEERIKSRAFYGCKRMLVIVGVGFWLSALITYLLEGIVWWVMSPVWIVDFNFMSRIPTMACLTFPLVVRLMQGCRIAVICASFATTWPSSCPPSVTARRSWWTLLLRSNGVVVWLHHSGLSWWAMQEWWGFLSACHSMSFESATSTFKKEAPILI